MSARLAALRRLHERLRTATSGVDFYAFVRELERLLSEDVAIGGDLPAERERVHFTHSPDFVSAPGDVVDLAISEEDAAHATVTTTFLGLLGTESPLGPVVSERVLFEDAPFRLRAFYDVFQDRALALLYRAQKRFSPLANDGAGRDDFARGLLSLVGVDAFAPPNERAAVDPMEALGLSDLLRCDPNYVDLGTLESILQRFVPELRPRVSSGKPEFVAKASEDLSRLGVQKCTLGETFSYGFGAFDVDSRIRLTVGPVTRKVYEALMPGGKRYRALRAMLNEWLAGRVTIELEVIVSREEAPSFRLGVPFGSRLGEDVRYASGGPLIHTRVLLLDDEAEAVRSYHDG